MKPRVSITKSKSGHYTVTVRSVVYPHIVRTAGKLGHIEAARAEALLVVNDVYILEFAHAQKHAAPGFCDGLPGAAIVAKL